MQITISRLHFPITTLGPGRRIGVWFQGCKIACPGCVSADTWSFERGKTSVDEVLVALSPWLPLADGLTLSGGEPFDQPDALVALVRAVKLRDDQDLLVYSGYPVESLRHVLDRCRGHIDALISDPFEMDAPQTLALRGSDNQRLHFLTERGRHRFGPYAAPSAERPRSLDLMFDDDGTIWLAGIPRQHDMLRLQELLGEQGHTIVTTLASGRIRSK